MLVIGGSGEYRSVADRIYMLDDFKIYDVTEKAKRLCSSDTPITAPEKSDWSQSRTLLSRSFVSRPEGSGSERLEVSDMGFVIIGDERIDVRGLHDIVSASQFDALGFMLRDIENAVNTPVVDLDGLIDLLYRRIDEEGLDCVYSSFFTTANRFLSLPRQTELKLLVNRMRKINVIKT